MVLSPAIKRILLAAVALVAPVAARAADFGSYWSQSGATSTASDSKLMDGPAAYAVRQAAYIPQQPRTADRTVIQANRLSDGDAKQSGMKPLANDSVMLPEPVPAKVMPPTVMGDSSPKSGSMILSADDPRLTQAAAGHGLFDPIETYEQPGEAPVCSSGCCLNDSLWFADMVVLYYHHGRPDEKVLFQDFSEDHRQFKASDATYSWNPTGSLTLGRYLGRDCQNRDHDIEFGFVAPIKWSGDAAFTSQERVSVFAPENQRFAGFNFADSAFIHLESEYSSYEFNWRIRTRIGRDQMVYHCDGSWGRECTPNYTYSILGGIRFVSLQDEVTLRTRITNIQDTDFHGNYNVETQNYLFGPQVGGDLIEQHCNWNYGARCRLGLLYGDNSAHRVVDGLDNVIGGLNPVSIDSKQHGDQLAFLGDIGITATYNFRPNLIGRVAYDFLMISDIAEGAHQIKFQQDQESVLYSNLVIHGLTLGLEYQW